MRKEHLGGRNSILKQTYINIPITTIASRDIIAMSCDPLKDTTELERVQFVMKGGIVYKAKGKEVIVTPEAK